MINHLILPLNKSIKLMQRNISYPIDYCDLSETDSHNKILIILLTKSK